MKKQSILLFSIITALGYSQKSIDKVLQQLNSNAVPYIYAQELSKLSAPIILDAREQTEFEISHIKGAIFVGYDKFDIARTTQLLTSKTQKIVVYCSLGVRSERIGEKLLKAGYTNVYNQHGGIFDWKNKGFDVVDSNNVTTQNVHAYSKIWSKYLTKGNKIY